MSRPLRDGPLTAQMAGALHFLVSAGSLQVRRSNRFVFGEVSGRTAYALERRGLAERRYTGPAEPRTIYATQRGREVADTLLDLDEEDYS